MMKKIFQIVLIVLLATACGQKKKAEVVAGTEDFMLHKVVVEEVVQTSNYTYLEVIEGSKKYWTAVAKGGYIVGEQFFYFDAAATIMENYHSRELDCDFDTVLFISKVSKESHHETLNRLKPTDGGTSHIGRKEVQENDAVSVTKAIGGITIAELYEHKVDYANKKVKIKGIVVKVNSNIMGRNWVHIQDGTKFGNDYDLTITTQDVVEVNDEVSFEGVVAIEKDFTSGYFYPVIVEEATMVE